MHSSLALEPMLAISRLRQRSSMEEESKSKKWWIIPHDTVLDRLYHWPLLRQLKAERRFRYVFFTLMALVIVICASIPQVWIVTPKGMNPVVRIRGLDFLEARIFSEIARNQERRGERAEAWQYWRQACGHNPTSIELLQSAVRNSWELPSRNYSYFVDAVNKASGLIALDGQNPLSVYYAAKTYFHFRLYDIVLTLGANSPATNNRALSLLALQARLLTGDKDGYLRARQVFTSPEEQTALQVFDWSQSAAWSSNVNDASKALKNLLAACEDPNSQNRALALRLTLLVGSERANAKLFERSLAALHDDHNDEPLQYVKYWQILEGAGQRDRAIAEAAKAEIVPISSTELLGVANAFEHLGMVEQAIAYLERFAFPINANSSVWLRFGDLLIAQRRWDDLRKVAIDIRRCPASAHELGGYSHFLEGLALKANGENQDAAINFRKVPMLTIPRPDLAVLVAAKMAVLDSPEPALQLALQHEGSLSNQPSFWGLLTRLAGQIKDSNLLLRAAQKAYELDPKNPAAKNDYVAALAVNGISPEVLLTLSGELKRQFPDSTAISIHRALALIENHRTNEAAAAVAALPESAQSDLENSLLAMARGRLASLQRNWASAYSNYNQIDSTLLFRTQINRMLRFREEAAVEMDRVGTRNQVP